MKFIFPLYFQITTIKYLNLPLKKKFTYIKGNTHMQSNTCTQTHTHTQNRCGCWHVMKPRLCVDRSVVYVCGTHPNTPSILSYLFLLLWTSRYFLLISSPHCMSIYPCGLDLLEKAASHRLMLGSITDVLGDYSHQRHHNMSFYPSILPLPKKGVFTSRLFKVFKFKIDMFSLI